VRVRDHAPVAVEHEARAGGERELAARVGLERVGAGLHGARADVDDARIRAIVDLVRAQPAAGPEHDQALLTRERAGTAAAREQRGSGDAASEHGSE
jgi:hypothetical protein